MSAPYHNVALAIALATEVGKDVESILPKPLGFPLAVLNGVQINFEGENFTDDFFNPLFFHLFQDGQAPVDLMPDWLAYAQEHGGNHHERKKDKKNKDKDKKAKKQDKHGKGGDKDDKHGKGGNKDDKHGGKKDDKHGGNKDDKHGGNKDHDKHGGDKHGGKDHDKHKYTKLKTY